MRRSPLIAALVAAALLVLSAQTAPAAETAPPLTVRTLSPRDRGAVALQIGGAPGTPVTVSERGQKIAAATVGPDGLVTARDVAYWSCGNRDRTFTVTSADGATASVTTRTPSCGQRLSIVVPTKVAPGAAAAMQLADRWQIGPVLDAQACLQTPAARPRCSRLLLRPGTPGHAVRWTARRPGRTLVQVHASGRTYRRSVTTPSKYGRLRVLAAGDSEMQLLDEFIGEDLGSRAHVRSDARISTGLTNTFFFDWVGHARSLGAAFQPDVTVMFVGANDGFPLPSGGGTVACCSHAWSVAFARRASAMVASFSRGGAGVVYWFLLPTPRGGEFQRVFRAVNAGYRIAAAADPDDLHLIDSVAEFTPHGYRDTMSTGSGSITIHESDGVHLSISADRIAARLVVAQLRADRLID